jgi:hypothetical protein
MGAVVNSPVSSVVSVIGLEPPPDMRKAKQALISEEVDPRPWEFLIPRGFPHLVPNRGDCSSYNEGMVPVFQS